LLELPSSFLFFFFVQTGADNENDHNDPVTMDGYTHRDASSTRQEGYFVLHAGATNSWETNLALQQAIEKVLFETAETARTSLRAGASALEVVETAVVALEDCPFFNAGKGAALTEDGTHEV
jgi:hypothetical protein